MLDKKWLQVTGLALSFPSTILVAAYVMKLLVEKEILSKTTGVLIFLAIIFNTIYLMVYYAFKNKNKS
ncbi:hypothetical protein BIY24_00035 [Halobacteriovorax marinus]|uniref:Integral membrane protein n=1 Tax=Halobacteriovorax marinus (strain ATCC BAA-682 / DSM 15412 / SJ) TaxID=862908 RepID=E1X1N0_HALMS|nr:hypothetical protein [Halobacteriovorax marinus]ATH06387.1 hypothetical protein BIY24_00035 [Halobacteriovorax marinus]CBW24949.1 putative integral membrane protein [Halobacteriovorax marinus SJ]